MLNFSVAAAALGLLAVFQVAAFDSVMNHLEFSVCAQGPARRTAHLDWRVSREREAPAAKNVCAPEDLRCIVAPPVGVRRGREGP